MKQPINFCPQSVLRLDGQSPVLLELGQSDEALRYYAYLRPAIHSEAYELSIHNDSALLDILRLKRTLNICLKMADTQRYRALLNLHNDVVLVSIGEPLDSEMIISAKICPLT
jgi:hypothetical protein